MSKATKKKADDKTSEDQTSLAVLDGGISPEEKEEYDKLRAQVLEYKGKLDTARWDLAAALYRIHDASKAIYHLWGYTSWEKYVEREVGYGARTAQYLIEMYECFEVRLGGKLGEKNKELLIKAVRELGWTKARMLTKKLAPKKGKVANFQEAMDWIERAKDMSATELDSLLKSENTGGGSGSGETMRNISFRCSDDQLEPVENALELAGSMLESTKRGHQLSMICQDFVATNMAQGDGGQKRRDTYFNKIGAIFGVKLIAVDKETKEVVHGESLLKKIEKKEEK